MQNIRTGTAKTELDPLAVEFNSSIQTDKELFRQDIGGSIAHAKMLANSKIISNEEGKKIVEGLTEILSELESGKLKFDEKAEDIHMFVEAVLTKKLGDIGKKLHTARSRNDQVALDLRMYCAEKIACITTLVRDLIKTLCTIAEKHTDTVMPGYTHMQRAQPVSLAFHLCAYGFMLARDVERLEECQKRTKISPLGSCALAGTSYPIDRKLVASNLNFFAVTENAMDGVSDRDFALELASDLAILMTHLSRFCEEIILWCSSEFKFMELSDAFATGSSIMPQKKNPDVAELVRGKTGRVFGNLVALLTVMKGLPLAYNKDMQEDKDNLFDSIETVEKCLPVFTKMLATATFLKDNMKNACEKGFITATEIADFLTKAGVPFRDAYDLVGKEIIAYCVKNNKTLTTMTLEEYKSFSDKFTAEILEKVKAENCLNAKTSLGGTSVDAVKYQIRTLKELSHD